MLFNHRKMCVEFINNKGRVIYNLTLKQINAWKINHNLEDMPCFEAAKRLYEERQMYSWVF